MEDFYRLEAYDYYLPPDKIAQYPCEPRDSSRLLVVDRATGNLSEIVFRDIVDLLHQDDGIVFNDTKVIPARLLGRKSSGAAVELFLTEPTADGSWKALAKPGKKLKPSSVVIFGDDFQAEIQETYPDGTKRVSFSGSISFEEGIQKYGEVPLPPYIKRDVDNEYDKQRYQTVVAKQPGAVAAPTAGLHFTKELLASLGDKNVDITTVTLHVGLGTFLGVKVDDIRSHDMHEERYHISDSAAKKLSSKKEGSRQICVGTTCCRVLESAVLPDKHFKPGCGSTDIFIYPGYEFKYVDCLLTNFHLPKSTLLMLVSAFAGYELIREAYAKAIKDGFRFYSYGDAMLIL